MKKTLVVCLLVATVITIIAKPSHAMRIPVDASVGFGTTYGGAGAKLTLGQILFAGAGKLAGETMWSAGVQVPFNFSSEEKYASTPYIGVSYGGIAVKEETIGLLKDTEVVKGFSVFAGYVWGWESGLFVHVDLGVSKGKYTQFEDTVLEEEKNLTTVALDLGVGYRFF
jgi:hypothetical protein